MHDAALNISAETDSVPSTLASKDGGTVAVTVERVSESGRTQASDRLAVEEPLEIRLIHGSEGTERSLAVTMRTPGNDVDLAIGFLCSEGVIGRPDDVASAVSLGELSCAEGKSNTIVIRLNPGVAFDAGRLERNFYTTSSCGVCGKTSIASITTSGAPALDPGRPIVGEDVIRNLPAALKDAQTIFGLTGGLHAAALFDGNGMLLDVREDVGRHNAFDKLVGAFFVRGRLPLLDAIVLISGRASFELVQKALMAGIPIMAAVGAPSSLAVDLAEAHGMTLAGFVRNGRFNIYCGRHRITP